MPYIEWDGQARALGPGVLTVGSAPEAGWRIQGRDLAPIHALFALTTGTRVLLTRGSAAAAVTVNGTDMVEPRGVLEFGDRVRMGTVELHYRQFPPGGEGHSAYLRDTRRGRLYQLRERNTIGRDLMNTVVVQEPDVSRTHAEIVRHGEAYLIAPQPASVTSVNGARLLAAAPLQEGDEIAVGHTVLRFTSALPAGAARWDGPARESVGRQARSSRAATTFMGQIEARDLKHRDTRRKISRFVAITVSALAVAAALASLYVGAHRPIATLAPRKHGAHAGAY